MNEGVKSPFLGNDFDPLFSCNFAVSFYESDISATAAGETTTTVSISRM